jgi:hypothetical protein
MTEVEDKVAIARLDERMGSLEDIVLNIRDNHLAHIAEDIEKSRENQWRIFLTLSVIVTAINGTMGVVL